MRTDQYEIAREMIGDRSGTAVERIEKPQLHPHQEDGNHHPRHRRRKFRLGVRQLQPRQRDVTEEQRSNLDGA